MLLKNTAVGDVEVQSDNESSARSFLEGLIARGELATDDSETMSGVTHAIVTENGVKKLQRIGFNKVI